MVMLRQLTSRSTGRDTALPGAACRSNEYRPTRVVVGKRDQLPSNDLRQSMKEEILEILIWAAVDTPAEATWFTSEGLRMPPPQRRRRCVYFR